MTLWRCPRCYEHNDPSIYKCSNCDCLIDPEGQKIFAISPEEQKRYAVSGTNPEDSCWLCPQCGKLIDEFYLKCNCGYTTTREEVEKIKERLALEKETEKRLALEKQREQQRALNRGTNPDNQKFKSREEYAKWKEQRIKTLKDNNRKNETISPKKSVENEIEKVSNYHQILGIQQNASKEEIKQAYKDLLKIWNPERFNDDQPLKRKAQEKSKEIDEAYEQLIINLSKANENIPDEESKRNNEHSQQLPKDSLPNMDSAIKAKTNYEGCSVKEQVKIKDAQPAEQQSTETKESINKADTQKSERLDYQRYAKTSQPPSNKRRDNSGNHNSVRQAPRPWVRYWARTLDIFLIESLAIIPVYIFLGIVTPKYLTQMSDHLVSLFYTVALFSFPIAFVIEAFIISFFGNTPAKAILKIRITNSEGNSLSFTEALKRNMYIYIAGCGMGLPLIPLFTLLHQYNQLKKHGKTSWDSYFDYKVSHSDIGGVRILCYIALFFICAFTIAFGDLIVSERNKNQIDYSTMTDEELLARINSHPRTPDGKIDFSNVSDEELLAIARVGKKLSH